MKKLQPPFKFNIQRVVKQILCIRFNPENAETIKALLPSIFVLILISFHCIIFQKRRPLNHANSINLSGNHVGSHYHLVFGAEKTCI